MLCRQNPHLRPVWQQHPPTSDSQFHNTAHPQLWGAGSGQMVKGQLQESTASLSQCPVTKAHSVPQEYCPTQGPQEILNSSKMSTRSISSRIHLPSAGQVQQRTNPNLSFSPRALQSPPQRCYLWNSPTGRQARMRQG